MRQTVVAAGLLFMLVSPVAAQEELRWNDAEKQLVEMLKATPHAPIRIENVGGAPVTVIEAEVKAVRPGPSISSALRLREFVMQEKIALVNNTDKQITRVELQLIDINGLEEVALYNRTVIAPFSTHVVGEPRRSGRDFESSSADPLKLSVKVRGVRFADGFVWDLHRPKAMRLKVDAIPVLLNRPQPVYTEEALKNRIQGRVRMWLLVGRDGEVSNMRTITGLPDGLTEEAILEAYKLKFLPATKDGQPVEYWVSYEVDFNLPETKKL